MLLKLSICQHPQRPCGFVEHALDSEFGVSECRNVAVGAQELRCGNWSFASGGRRGRELLWLRVEGSDSGEPSSANLLLGQRSGSDCAGRMR